MKGKGVNLPMPTLGSFTLPLKVELHNSSTSTCWRTQFSAPSKNDSTQFKAKDD
jgi:hypothetical protein